MDVRRRTRWWLGCLMTIQALFLCSLVAAKSAQPRTPLRTPFYPTIFSVVELTLDGYPRSAAVGLNDSGQVLCSAAGDDGVPVHGFVWQQGTTVDIGSLRAGRRTIPYGINAAGSVVGASETEDGLLRAFLWDGSTMQGLSLPVGYTSSEAHAISADGRIAGDLVDASGHHAAVWTGDRVELLPSLPGFSTSRANAINASGQVVGTAFTDGGPPGKGHAVLWQGGQAIDLGVASGYSFSEANTINEAGVIGGCSTELPSYQVAMVWRTGSTSVLQGIGTVWAINDLGWTVGENVYTVPRYDNGRHATLYYGTDPVDITERVTYASGYYHDMVSATGINAQAQVSANGFTHRALLLQPKVTALSYTVETPSSPVVGQDTTITVNVTNAGPDEALNFEVELDFDETWEVVSATSALGTPQIGTPRIGGYTAISTAALPPGVWQLVVTVRPRAAGVLGARLYLQAANAPSTISDLSVAVPGTPSPVIDGHVNLLPASHPRSGEELRLVWNVFLANNGTASLPAGECALFLSATPSLAPGAKRFDSFPFRAIKPGSYAYRQFSRKFPRTHFPTGSYLIAVVDPDRDNRTQSRIGAVFVSDPFPTP